MLVLVMQCLAALLHCGRWSSGVAMYLRVGLRRECLGVSIHGGLWISGMATHLYNPIWVPALKQCGATTAGNKT